MSAYIIEHTYRLTDLTYYNQHTSNNLEIYYVKEFICRRLAEL